MELRWFVLQPTLTRLSPGFTTSLRHTDKPKTQRAFQFSTGINRRRAAMIASLLLAREAVLKQEVAYGLDLRLIAPDQSIQEAESGIRGHARALLQVKALIDSESWVEAQKALRKSSALLKQDVYTIIQNKPATERPQLRKLYSDLFNNVSRLDYAARDGDESSVLRCYENIVVALSDILSRI
ncbi:psbQ-like protein 3, chloroplastic [Ziziphus jujuba]|uniref:PsbQ-like protein 3, chloroplastic n=1 Tax=Ziziphus jujuba TaxID=326968 RepID=A0A6P4AL61_ZIZJJ|nr:psbQ-like protein 3, chloroplastic [Ziziphus jujuba]